jgi:hypothetical protein
MNTRTFNELRHFELMKRRAFKPSVRITSRRSAKHNSVGKWFKGSRVVEQVSLEKTFNKPGWVNQKQNEQFGR